MDHFAACRNLYHAAFPVEPAFDDRLFSLYAGQYLQTIETEGQPVCMAFCLPVTWGERTGVYLYALTTHPAYRHRGYMARLLSEIEQRYADSAAFLCLSPANEALWDTYTRYGFEGRFYRPQSAVVKEPLTPLKRMADVAALRARLSPRLIAFDETYLSLVGQYCRFFVDADGTLVTCEPGGTFFEALGAEPVDGARVAAVKWLCRTPLETGLFSYPMQ